MRSLFSNRFSTHWTDLQILLNTDDDPDPPRKHQQDNNTKMVRLLSVLLGAAAGLMLAIAAPIDTSDHSSVVAAKDTAEDPIEP